MPSLKSKAKVVFGGSDGDGSGGLGDGGGGLGDGESGGAGDGGGDTGGGGGGGDGQATQVISVRPKCPPPQDQPSPWHTRFAQICRLTLGASYLEVAGFHEYVSALQLA